MVSSTSKRFHLSAFSLVNPGRDLLAGLCQGVANIFCSGLDSKPRLCGPGAETAVLLPEESRQPGNEQEDVSQSTAWTQVGAGLGPQAVIC